MRMKGIGMLDIDAERAYWKTHEGAPNCPHSSNWDLTIGIAASVLLNNPDGDMGEWLPEIRAKLQARGAMIPDAEVTAISTAVLERLARQAA